MGYPTDLTPRFYKRVFIHSEIISISSKSMVDILIEGGFDISFKSYPKAHNLEADEIEMISEWMKARL